LTKAVGLDDLIGKGINSVSDLKANMEYDFGLNPNTQILIPSDTKIGEYGIDAEVEIAEEKGGGSGKIEQLVLLTDENKKTRLYANIRLEDDSLGMIPLTELTKINK
jgi:hypothetical protein